MHLLSAGNCIVAISPVWVDDLSGIGLSCFQKPTPGRLQGPPPTPFWFLPKLQMSGTLPCTPPARTLTEISSPCEDPWMAAPPHHCHHEHHQHNNAQSTASSNPRQPVPAKAASCHVALWPIPEVTSGCFFNLTTIHQVEIIPAAWIRVARSNLDLVPVIQDMTWIARLRRVKVLNHKSWPPFELSRRHPRLLP